MTQCKNALLVILILFSSGNLVAQNPIDSLMKSREALLEEKQSLENEIEELEKEILEYIEQHGHEMELGEIPSYSKVEITENPGSGEQIGVIESGDKITFYGKESIYYKVEKDGKIGYAYISDSYLQFPITIIKSNYSSTTKSKGTQGTGRSYYKGPRGGCYYYGSGGKKVYVERNLCN